MRNWITKLNFFFFVEVIYCGGFKVLSPSSISGDYLTGPFPGLQPEEFSITGNLVAANPLYVCSYDSLINKEEIIGKIVVVTDEDCDPWKKVAAIKEGQGLGVIYITDEGLLGSFYPTHLGQQPSGMWIPMVAISYTNGYIILDALGSQEVFAIMETPNGNPSQEWIDGPGGVMFQVSLELYAFVGLLLGIYKLWKFIQFYGVQISITQTCLFLHIIGFIFRLVYLVDPINFHGYFNHLATATLVNMSTPFTLMSTLLMSFYWLEMLTRWSSNAHKKLQNLSRLKIPFIITGIVVFILLILGMILAGVDLSLPFLLTLNTVVVFVVSMLVALFFIFNGVRILRTLSIVPEEQHSRKWKRLSTITILLLSSGAAYIIFGCFLLSLVSEIGQSTIQGTLFCWWMLFAMLNTIGTTEIVAFHIPKKTYVSSVS